MSHLSTRHPHDPPSRGPLTRLLGGLAPRGRGRGAAPAATVLDRPAAVPTAPAATVLDRPPAPRPAPAAGEPVAPPALTPAWHDWADRRRTEAVPTPWRGHDDGAGQPRPAPLAVVVPHATTPPPPHGPVRPAGPWAAVRLDDGRTVTVTSTVLLGRAPAARTGETPGALVTVADPGRSVSKTHLAVGVDADGAWVVDRSSTNGAVVTLPDGSRILCVPERRVRLVPGASVAFGDAALTLTAVARHHATDQKGAP